MGSILGIPPEAAYAIRFTTSVCVAIWLGHLPGLIANQGVWALITVLMVSQPSPAGSLTKGLARVSGTIAAGIVAIVIFGLLSQDPPLLLAALLTVQVVGAYGFTGARQPYAWFCFAFTTAIVLGAALAGGEHVETVAFQRVTMVGLGIVIVLLGDMLLWPTRSEVGIRKGLADRARTIGEALRRAILDPQGEGTASKVSPLGAQLAQLEAARAEIGVTEERVEALRKLALLLEAAESRIRSLRAGPREALLAHDVTAALGRFADHIDEAFGALATALEVAEITPETLATLEVACAAAETELRSLTEPSQSNPALSRRLPAFDDLVQLVLKLQQGFAEILAAEGVLPKASRAEAVPESGWSRPDPFRMQIALRAGIAVGVAILLPMSLGWSLNTLVAPIAFMLASIPTRGGAAKTIPVLLVVFAGAWLVADLLLVFAGPSLGSVPIGLLPAAALTAVTALVSAKKPQLEVVRTIGCLLALLPLYGGQAPPTDVYGSYSTMCYMAVAVGAGWAATHMLWPATAATLFRLRAAALLDLCRELLLQERPDDAPRQRSQALETFAAQLTGLGTLHVHAESEGVELGLDGQRRASLVARIQDLFDACLATRVETEVSPERGLLAERIASAAEGLRSGQATTPPKTVEPPRPTEQRLAASERLLGIEDWFADWQDWQGGRA